MALTFVDTDFPSNLTVGLVGNTMFTSVEVAAPSGITDVYELGPEYARLKYTFDGSNMEIRGTEMLQLKSFYIQYRYNSFRLRDPLEYEADGDLFGTGDGSTTAFQLYVNYGSIDKPITKPVDDANFKVYDNGVEQTNGVDYTVDDTTGIVTFTVAPANTNPLTWEGIYDIHVRFDIDSLNSNVGGLRYGNYTGIGLIEEITL